MPFLCFDYVPIADSILAFVMSDDDMTDCFATIERGGDGGMNFGVRALVSLALNLNVTGKTDDVW